MYSVILALSTYSKIPMPQLNDEKIEKGMRHMLSAFFLVGVIVGLLQSLILQAYFSLNIFWGKNLNTIFIASILTVIPLLITGGIHLDGYMDVSDAMSSYQSRERKLEIMKDPHIGAFAAIRMGILLVLELGCYSLISDRFMNLSLLERVEVMAVLILLQIFVRTISGYMVLAFEKAKPDGMAAAICKASVSGQSVLMKAEMVIAGAFLIFVPVFLGEGLWYLGLAAFLAIFLTFIIFKNKTLKEFGGMTGDLAGYFLETAVLNTLVVLALVIC